MVEAKIKKDDLIGDVVGKYPQVVEVLMAEGVHCVGCGAASFETLEQGLMGHGRSEEEVEAILKDLNEVADEAPIPPKPEAKPSQDNNHKDMAVKITGRAADKVKQIAKEEGKEGYGLRIEVVPGGCSGFQYGFDFENEEREDDTVYTINEVPFYVDAASLEILAGSEVDYVESLMGAGFKINNPNAQSSCGCGQSFN